MSRKSKRKSQGDVRQPNSLPELNADELRPVPDWTGKCQVCGETPIVPETGMCGPCTFGDASTVGGNW